MQSAVRGESNFSTHTARPLLGWLGKALSSLGALEGWVTQAPIRKSGRCGQGGGEASRWRTLRGPVQRREGGCEPQQAAFLLGPDLLGPEGQQM